MKKQLIVRLSMLLSIYLSVAERQAVAQEDTQFLTASDGYVRLNYVQFRRPGGAIFEFESDADYFELCSPLTAYICIVSDSPEYNFAFPRNFENQTSWTFGGYEYTVLSFKFEAQQK